MLDTESIKRKIREEIDKVKAEYPDSTIINRLDDTEKAIINEIDSNIQMLPLDGIIRQKFLYLMAGFYTCTDERKSWYYYHAIMSIIVIDEIEQILRTKYGRRYADVLDRLLKYSTMIERLKHYLDGCEEKTIQNNDITKIAFIKAMDILSKMPLINYELNHIFIIITNNTTLGKQTVPSSSIQLMERQHKKIRYEEEKRPETEIEEL